MIDTHCHLNWDTFEGEEANVITRAQQAGVKQLLCVGYDLHSSRKAIALAEEFPMVFAAVGIHPNDCADAPSDWERQLLDLAQHPKVLAIGETGMDFYRDRSSPEQQEQFFITQIHLAQELGLPVIVHNRQAFSQIERLLEKVEYRRMVFHCWSEDWEAAERILARGCYLSFTGSLTFKNNRSVQEVAKRMPAERILLETDAPFLTPMPYRGRFPNEPAYLPHVASFLAELRETSAEEIDNITSNNARNFFKFPTR